MHVIKLSDHKSHQKLPYLDVPRGSEHLTLPSPKRSTSKTIKGSSKECACHPFAVKADSSSGYFSLLEPLNTKCLFTQNYHLYFRERTNLLSNGTSGRRTCRSNWHIACKSAMAERKTCQFCEALMEFYRFLASALFISSSHFKSQRCVVKKSATRSLHILVWHHALQDNNVASKQPVLIFLPWTRPVSNCRMTIK